MKNALLTLILTFGILSCNAQSQREKEEKIRAEINTEFEQIRLPKLLLLHSQPHHGCYEPYPQGCLRQ